MRAIKTKAIAMIVVGTIHLYAVPSITFSSTWNEDGTVTVDYTLDSPAVVTMDVLTNGTGGAWTSVGGKALWNAWGDVFRKVDSSTGRITWKPSFVSRGGGEMRIELSAWPLDDTPDYMVVSLYEMKSSNSPRIRYYPAVDFLPGGLLDNTAYRVEKIVMRKIHAKGVTWNMGAGDGESAYRYTSFNREHFHQVTMTNNYYIGVFEVTEAQWSVAKGLQATADMTVTNATFKADWMMRPACRSFASIRGSGSANFWPQEVRNWLYGIRKAKTGVDFDIPSEAQWEYACRAGHGDGEWGNGTSYTGASRAAAVEDENLDEIARYKGNGGVPAEGDLDYGKSEADYSVASGPAIVGTYKPNDWGLYDMHGNVAEWCLDYWVNDWAAYADFAKNGMPNCYRDKLSDGSTSPPSTANRVIRGGSWQSDAYDVRSSYKVYETATTTRSYIGFRLVCRMELK